MPFCSDIVVRNELLSSAFSMNINELRLFLFALSIVDSRKPNTDELVIYPKTFSEQWNLSDKNVHRDLFNSANSLRNKNLTVNENGEEKEIKIFDSIVYGTSEEHGVCITGKFSEEIKKYVFEFKSGFTRIKLQHISNLNTVLSLRVYAWLKQHQFKCQFTKDESVQIPIRFKWMKEKLGISKNYKYWSDFNKKLLEPAVDRINSHTDIEVVYHRVKPSTTVIGASFFIKGNLESCIPIRPRLMRYPKKPAPQQISSWASTNLKLLEKYVEEMKEYKEDFSLTKRDLEKCFKYAEILQIRPKEKFYREQLKLKMKNSMKRNTVIVL